MAQGDTTVIHYNILNERELIAYIVIMILIRFKIVMALRDSSFNNSTLGASTHLRPGNFKEACNSFQARQITPKIRRKEKKNIKTQTK